MGKLPKIALAVLLCVAVGVFAWQLWPSPEPVYQGKRLLRWLDDAFWSGGPSGETATAIKSMGTNALPTLLRMIQAKDSAFQDIGVAERVP